MRIHLYTFLQRGEVTALLQSSVVVETVPHPNDEYDREIVQCDMCNG